MVGDVVTQEGICGESLIGKVMTQEGRHIEIHWLERCWLIYEYVVTHGWTGDDSLRDMLLLIGWKGGGEMREMRWLIGWKGDDSLREMW